MIKKHNKCMKQTTFKRPESVLVVIYCKTTKRVLMLQRKDDLDFWQSVTGSLENDENLPQFTAIREVKEETGLDADQDNCHLIDCQYVIEFDIFPQFWHRYAPNVRKNKEHWFYLELEDEPDITMAEHHAYCWLPAKEAMNLTKSWSNRAAIEACSALK